MSAKRGMGSAKLDEKRRGREGRGLLYSKKMDAVVKKKITDGSTSFVIDFLFYLSADFFQFFLNFILKAQVVVGITSVRPLLPHLL